MAFKSYEDIAARMMGFENAAQMNDPYAQINRWEAQKQQRQDMQERAMWEKLAEREVGYLMRKHQEYVEFQQKATVTPGGVEMSTLPAKEQVAVLGHSGADSVRKGWMDIKRAARQFSSAVTSRLSKAVATEY